jgi:hypothetical protein
LRRKEVWVTTLSSSSSIMENATYCQDINKTIRSNYLHSHFFFYFQQNKGVVSFLCLWFKGTGSWDDYFLVGF